MHLTKRHYEPLKRYIEAQAKYPAAELKAFQDLMDVYAMFLTKEEFNVTVTCISQRSMYLHETLLELKNNGKSEMKLPSTDTYLLHIDCNERGWHFFIDFFKVIKDYDVSTTKYRHISDLVVNQEIFDDIYRVLYNEIREFVLRETPMITI